METGTYKTKQREIILNFLKTNTKNHVTIEDVSDHLKKQNEKVGQTTIYRYVNMLVQNGVVRKYITGAGQPACFQFVENTSSCSAHYHLKCNDCSEVIHADSPVFKNIENHLNSEHSFKIDTSKLLLYGTCNKCI